MKKLALFLGLCGAAIFLTLIIDMVFEYYYIGWHKVIVRRS